MRHTAKIALNRSVQKQMAMMLTVLCAAVLSAVPVHGETANDTLDIRKTVNTVVDIATQWPSELETSIADMASGSFPLPEMLETTEANIASQSNDPWLAHVKTPIPATEQEMNHPTNIQLECMRFGQESYMRFREVFGSSPDPIKFFEDPETYQKAKTFGVSSGGALGVMLATLNHPMMQEAQAMLRCKIDVPMTAEQMSKNLRNLKSELTSLFPGEEVMISGPDGEALTPSDANVEYVMTSFGGKEIGINFLDYFEMSWIKASSPKSAESIKFQFMVFLPPRAS